MSARYECRACEGRGEVTRDHVYYQDGATQYETIDIACPSCGGSGEDGPAYDDLDALPSTRIGSLAVGGDAIDVRALDGDLGEVEQYAHILAVRERERRILRMRARVASMRGVWR